MAVVWQFCAPRRRTPPHLDPTNLFLNSCIPSSGLQHCQLSAQKTLPGAGCKYHSSVMVRKRPDSTPPVEIFRNVPQFPKRVLSTSWCFKSNNQQELMHKLQSCETFSQSLSMRDCSTCLVQWTRQCVWCVDVYGLFSEFLLSPRLSSSNWIHQSSLHVSIGFLDWR